MSFPNTQNLVPLTRAKQGNPKPRQRLLPGEEALPTAQEVAEEAGGDVGGVVLDFGRGGGTRVDWVRDSLNGVGGSKGKGKDMGRRGRWDWVWAGTEDDVKLSVSQEAQLLFPPTRKVGNPVLKLPLNTLLLSSTAYVSNLLGSDPHFIIPDLVTEEIASVYAEMAKPKREVYAGHTLQVVYSGHARLGRWLLLFPMGELGNHLNISPFLPRSNAKSDGRGVSRFAPTAKASYRFPTTILQICSSPALSDHRLDYGATALIVRLQYSTHILNLIPNPSYIPPTPASPASCLPISVLTSAQTDGRRHVDVALDSESWSRALIVDEGGGVWLWWEEKVRESWTNRVGKEMRLKKIRSAITEKKDCFFRIGFGTRSDTAIVISDKKASIIEIEDPAHPETVLLELKGRNRIFTSMEKSARARRASFTCLCTTYEVIWVDEVKPGVPALSWRHDFGGGKILDLEVNVIETEGDESVLLSSPSNPLVMVFHTTSTYPLRSLHSPYSISIPIPESSKPLSSYTNIFLTINSTSRKAPTLLLGQSKDLAIWSTSLFQSGSDDDDEHELRSRKAREEANPPTRPRRVQKLKVKWDEDVQSLSESYGYAMDEVIGEKEKWREKARTRFKVLDLRWAWLKINDRNDRDLDEENYFSAEEFGIFLREMDAPFNHFMTGAELARDSINHESSDLRSHLLQRLPLRPGSNRGDVAELDRIDIGRHLPILARLPVSPFLCSDIAKSFNGSSAISILDHLKKSFPERAGTSYVPSVLLSQRRRDIESLAIDLFLSSTILSSEDLYNPSNPGARANVLSLPRSSFGDGPQSPEEMFERTAVLSLNDSEPPPIDFLVLQPRPSVDPDNEDDEDREGEEIENRHKPPQRRPPELQSMIARFLLADWGLGTDPVQYSWKSWVRQDTESLTPRRPIRPLPSPRTKQNGTFSQSQTSQYPSSLTQTQANANTQPSYGKTIPTITAIQPVHHPIPLRATASVPSLQVRPISHLSGGFSSPPPTRPQSASSQLFVEDHEGIYTHANTQVERGNFGGKLENKMGGKKKAMKKRVGGF